MTTQRTVSPTLAAAGFALSPAAPRPRCAFCAEVALDAAGHRHAYVLWRQAQGRVKHLLRGPRFAWWPNLGPWLTRLPEEVGLAPARARAAVLPTSALFAAARSMVG
ncbi:MAG: hypothetical protein AB7N76_18435 [Planctomycetota bacterium]